jgi:hypothetical protein
MPATANNLKPRTKRRRYNRWLTIGVPNPFIRTLKKARSLGLGIVNGGKPGMCAWYGICLVGTSEQIEALQDWWGWAGIEWFRRQPRGAWPVSDKGNEITWVEALENARQSA